MSDDFTGKGDELRDLICKRFGLKPSDIRCPRESSDMTPCVAKDGDAALTLDGHCVGCGQLILDLLEKERVHTFHDPACPGVHVNGGYVLPDPLPSDTDDDLKAVIVGLQALEGTLPGTSTISPTIEYRIVKASADFESMTGEKPRFLYLGLEDWQVLKGHYLALYNFDLTPINNQFQGLEILYVNKLRHLAVG